MKRMNRKKGGIIAVWIILVFFIVFVFSSGGTENKGDDINNTIDQDEIAQVVEELTEEADPTLVVEPTATEVVEPTPIPIPTKIVMELEDGSFTWPMAVITSRFPYTQSVDTGDIDMDGDIDIAAVSKENKITWWRNEGGEFIEWKKLTLERDFSWAHALAFEDIDQDGYLDILAAGYTANEFAWWRNSGGEEIEWVKHSIDADKRQALEIDAADFDGDGDMDVVGTTGLGLFAWQNVGEEDGEWISINLMDIMAFWPVKVGDLDGDGDADVLAGSDKTGTVNWLENKSAPDVGIKFEINTVTDDFESICSLSINDIDGDGDNDFIGTGTFTDTLAWYSNDGGNSIEWTKNLIADDFPGAIYVVSGDMDGDGDVDVVGSAYTSGEIAIWINEGGDPITWTKSIVGIGMEEIQGMALGDIDGDGDLDIVATAPKIDTLAWFENNLSN